MNDPKSPFGGFRGPLTFREREVALSYKNLAFINYTHRFEQAS